MKFNQILEKTSKSVVTIACITIAVAAISFGACLIKDNICDLFTPRKKKLIISVHNKPVDPIPAPKAEEPKKGGKK